MSLKVITEGAGPPLVLLHGWGLNSRVWDSVAPGLSRSFTLYRVDLPGHGGSAWNPELGSLEAWADAMAASLPAEFHLLGWSLGGMTAMAFTGAHRARVRRLVLVATTPKFLRSADWPHAVEERALSDMAARVMQDYQGTIRDFLLWQVHGDERARETLKELRRKVEEGGTPHPQALNAGLQILADSDLRPLAPDIAVPTLVISGERDRLVHPEACRVLAAMLPDARLHTMARAAHAPFLSHADEFCALVERFLKGSDDD